MASFLCDLVKQYVERLINQTITEARHVFCFTCIVNEFEEERATLEPERITMGQRVKVAIGRDKDIKANVGFWEEEVDKLNKLDTKTKETCFFGFCPDCVWRYKKGKELATNMVQIKQLKEKADKLENIELPRRLPDVERYSSQDYISFKSRESIYKELLDALKDDNNYITGLQGMGGTGKTTLAKEVGKELKQSEQFAHVIDTTVSLPDIKKIQDDIAGPLGLKWEDCNESDRPKQLWSRLTNGEKILLIMDDVWDRDPPLDFDAIGIPKWDNHKGCRVLVTSRSKQIFNKIGCDKRIEVELLSEEDAWFMFKRYAGISNSSSKNVIVKGRKIAKECKQLPVAIAVIARSLKGQQHREHEWDVTLKSLKKPVSMHGVDDDVVQIYKCLQFSYDYMKDEKAKGLFLLCSVFREDEKISIEVLTRLCIGAGLFGEDYGSYDDGRNQVVVAINKLLDSCLLLEVSKKKVKMHDLVRDVAQWIANKEILLVNLSDKNQKSLVERETDIKYLFCEGKDKDLLSCKFDGSKLETLIAKVDGNEDRECLEIPNSFFENLVKLRVLYFSVNDDNQPLSLPHSIQSLENIRSIRIEAANLGDISALENLQSLETLDLVMCKINELPREMAKLKKFKLLNLEKCVIRRKNPFKVIERCSSLEELYFINSFNHFCQETTLPELQRYQICNVLSVRMNRSLSKWVHLFGNDGTSFSKGTLKYIMQTTEIFSLNSIKGTWRNLMPEIVPIDLGMNDLVDLSLTCVSQLQCLIDTIGSQFPNVLPKLVQLELRGMEDLEELFKGPISFDSMESLEKLSIDDCKKFRRLFNCKLNLCNLKTMRLDNCPMLVSLFKQLSSRSLVLLETLEIAYCERLKHIIPDERREEESREEIDECDNSNKCPGSMFPNLKVLCIDGCPLLESIFPFLIVQDLPVLQKIRIRRCDGLKYIFGQYQHVEFSSLRELELCELPNFINMCRESNHPITLFAKGSSSTSNYGSKEQIQLDPLKSNIFSWTQICCRGNKYRHKIESTTTTRVPLVDGDQPQHYSNMAPESSSYWLYMWERVQCLPIQSNILCNITRIELSRFSKIKSVFILSIAPMMLLETLIIFNCDELKHIIIDTGDHESGGNVVFPKLKDLRVYNCMQLEYIIGHYDQNCTRIHLHFPALKYLILQNLPSLAAICPKHYTTTFPLLEHLQLHDSLQVANKSIGEFILHGASEFRDSTIMKELSGNTEHFLAVERLDIKNSKVESIFCLNEVNEQKMNLGLYDIVLQDLPVMMRLFVGPKNSLDLKNLARIKVARCEKLEIVFSTSILRCLPQLVNLRIEECEELKHIIEDDLENRKSSNILSTNTCFPMLETLAVVKCNKLKCVFPVSVCNELPELKVLFIGEADELEEIFKSEAEGEGIQKVEIPNLKIVAFVNLPSLCYAQGIQFQAVKSRFIQNCQKLYLTSTSTTLYVSAVYGFDFNIDYDFYRDLNNLFKQIQESRGHNAGNEYLSSLGATEDFAAEIEVQVTSGNVLTSSQEYGDDQIGIHSFSISTTETITDEDFEINNDQGFVNNDAVMKVSSTMEEQFPTMSSKDFPNGTEVESSSGHELTSSHGNGIESNIPGLETKMKQTAAKGKQEFVVKINGLWIPSVANSEDLLNEQSTSQQCLIDQQHPLGEVVTTVKLSRELLNEQSTSGLGEIDTAVKPSQGIKISVEDGNIINSQTITSLTHSKSVSFSLDPSTTSECETSSPLKGSTSEEAAAGTLSTISGTKNAPSIQLDITPEQKGIKKSVEEGTTSNYDKTITSSTHLEDGDGKIYIPSFSTANTKPAAAKYVDIGDSQETIAMEDINNLIEDDPLLAFEKLLTGQVSTSSIGVLLQELKTLMESSSDFDHLVSNQELKTKLIYLFHQLNQHQGMLTSDLKDFVEKVQNFFNENIIKHTTSQQVLNKHNQLLDLKSDLMNKLWSAKNTQAHIDSETSTANDQIHELSLQIDDLKSVVKKCNVQKLKLKAECTDWAQQSKELISALASSKVAMREVERARNLAKEDFENLKSSFPTF